MEVKKAQKQGRDYKTQKKTNLIQKNGGEERQEEYTISVPHT